MQDGSVYLERGVYFFLYGRPALLLMPLPLAGTFRVPDPLV